MLKPGPQNALTDVAGILVGHAEAPGMLTGTTVILHDDPMTAAADFRGGGTGTRDSEALSLEGTVQQVHAITLSGGSAFGLDAAGGVMDWLRRQGRGFAVGAVRVPIVPSAILFDLGLTENRAWDAPPWWDLGRQAAENARATTPMGNAGAGLGATAGPLKGGIGTASIQWRGLTIAALAVVNPMGSVTLPGVRHFWAGNLERGAEFGGLGPPPRQPEPLDFVPMASANTNTTLVVLATDAQLGRAQMKRIAIMGQDGVAMAIRPAHSPLDGDTVFALSTGLHPLADPLADLTMLGTLAAEVTARAIARGVFSADALAGFPCWRDL